MKTTKICAVVIALLLTTGIFAQQKTTFGIRGGVNFQNLNGKDASDDKLDNKLKTGFNAGVNAEIPVGIDFYLQPGVLFSTKGAKIEDTDNKISLSYVEVPVNFIYKPELGEGRMILGFGPYAAFAVGGKYKPENGNDVDIEFGDAPGMNDPEIFVLIQLQVGNDVAEQSIEGGINLEFPAVEAGQSATVGTDPKVAVLVFQHDVNM